MKLTVVLAEDEPLARDKMRAMLQVDPSLEIVAECVHGIDAVNAVEKHRPDILFLDVKMPELDGFGVLRVLDQNLPKAIVFVTAYDRFAVRAFEVNAVDYLLKPFDRSRMEQCLAKVKSHLRTVTAMDMQRRLEKVLESVDSTAATAISSRLVVKSQGRAVFVNTEDIDWIEAADNYMKLHTRQGERMMRETMSGLERKLDPEKFLRISRSVIVNTLRIQEIQPLFHGDSAVILKDATNLTCTRNYRENLNKLLER